MADIFISCNNADSEVVKVIVKALNEYSYSCWWYKEDSVPGRVYPEEIVREIEECRLVVLVFSSNAMSSYHVHNEVCIALSRGKKIIPFIIDNVDMNGKFEYYLATITWLNASDGALEKHINKLCRCVRKTLNPECLVPRVETKEACFSEEGIEEVDDRITYANGAVYEGETRDGKRHGHGRMIYANGDVNDGFWQDDQERFGIYQFSCGNVYMGYFDKDTFNGYGMMEYSNGDKYYGNFLNGDRHGEGVYIKKDGTEISGKWVFDEGPV